MVAQGARQFHSSIFRTTVLIFLMSALPTSFAKASFLKNLLQAVQQQKQQQEDKKKQQQQASVKKVQAKHHDHRYHKHHDDSHLKKWMAYWKKWGRKPAHSPTPVPPGYCPVDFQKKVTAVKVRGHHIYLDLNDLAFLKSAGFVLNEAELELVLQGRHQQQDSILVSLNGLKVSNPNRPRLNEMIEYFKSHDYSRTRFKLHHFFLNGSEPFHRYLARVKKNKGLLKISLYGKYYKIVSASVTFKGSAFEPCGNPGPGPGPGPGPNPTPEEDLTKYEAKIDSVSPTGSRVSSTNMLINFSTINTDGTYWCSLDNAPFEKCDSPISYAALSNGNHNFQVFATTPKGVDGAKTSYSWTVDNVRPVVTITNAGQLETLTNNSTISFEFTSTKAGTFRCSLDDATLFSCQSPMTYNVAGDGLHRFSVTAVDSLGNTSGSPASFQWTLDTTAPVANFISVSPEEEIGSNNSRSFSFGSNETSNFECSLDNSTFATCDSPLNVNSLSEGSHVMAIRPTDLAGNVGSIISHSWISDFTAPVLSLGTVSPMIGLTNSQSASVEFFMNEPGSAFCSWNSAPASNCSSPYVRSNISEGPNTLVIYAVDRAGLQSESVQLSWTVDLTAPMISFGQILPSAASNINSAQLSLNINSSEELMLRAAVNGIEVNIVNNMIALQNLSEAHYTVVVSGQDSAGNLSNTISHSFHVDLTAPVLSLSSDGNTLSNVTYRSFEFSSNEETSFECSLDDAGFTPCQSEAAYSGLADGEHTFVLRGTDLAGNMSLSIHSWAQDATAPGTSQSNVLNGTTIIFTLSSTEANVSYLCSLDGVPITPCNSTITYADLSVGDHIFLARSVDQAGNVDPIGAQFSFTIALPIRTIITGGNPPGELVNSNQMTISFIADQPALGFVCSLDGAPMTPCVSAVTYNNLSEGSHTAVIRAIDQFGVMDPIGATKTWTVDTMAPVVSNFTTSVTTNSITINWTTSEPATGRVNYGVGSALNQNTAEITTMEVTHSIRIVGLSSNTSYSIRVIGRDAAGNTYSSNVITVRTNR